MDSEKKLLMTMTGEIHQPVRLYYQVIDQTAVLKVFAKLWCLDEEQDNHRWVWLYHGEAKTLKFHTSYAAIPRKMRPIVLGAFRFTSAQEMTLDVRSCERATQAVVFFEMQGFMGVWNRCLPRWSRDYSKVTKTPSTAFSRVSKALSVTHRASVGLYDTIAATLQAAFPQ